MADVNFVDGDVVFVDSDVVWGESTIITLLPNTNYTINFQVVTSAPNASVTPYIGVTEGVTIYGDGWFTENIISPASGAGLTFITSNSTVSDVTIFAEGDFTLNADQTELDNAWQQLMILFATFCGLMKDKRIPAAMLIESIYRAELAYLKAAIIDIMLDSKNDVRYQ